MEKEKNNKENNNKENNIKNNNTNEANNKKKIFYVSIAVVALAVALIGATYAYFSANANVTGDSISGNTNDTLGNALTLNVTRLNQTVTNANSINLVPSDITATSASILNAVNNRCEASGYTGCHLYQIRATTTQNIPAVSINLVNLTITGSNSTTAVSSWKYALFTATGTYNTFTAVSPSSVTNGTGSFNLSTPVDMHNRAGLTVANGATYYLLIWIENDVSNAQNQNDANSVLGTYNGTVEMNAGTAGKVVACFGTGDECSSSNSSALPSFILNSNAPLDNVNSTYVQNQTPGIDFTQPSSDTNGKGLYIMSGTENDANPIYYYRGDVDDNNVYFGDSCWKIVRTTGTGGLKMIYNGTPTSQGTCGEDSGVSGMSNTIKANVKLLNNTNRNNKIDFLSSSQYNAYNDLTELGRSYFNHINGYANPKYVGYTYEDNGEEVDSTIKSLIDSWYEDNLLADYDDYIEDTVYCNDRSVRTDDLTAQEKSHYYVDGGDIVYGAYYRYIKGTPSLNCPQASDAYTVSSSLGNGKLDYPIGLLTMDEAWLAGEDNNSDATYNYYLYSNGVFRIWTSSPSMIYYIQSSTGRTDEYEAVYVLDFSRGIEMHDVSGTNAAIRVVISLKSGLNFLYGEGTVSNPYRFVENMPVEQEEVEEPGSGECTGSC